MKTINAIVSGGISNLTELQDALQVAIRLEFATLPPYLCAEWSIQGDDPDDVASMLHHVLFQEMQHFGLVCNMLAAIGGKPKIADPAFPVVYPSAGLPGGVHQSLTVDLLPLGPAALEMFKAIEFPQDGPIALDVGPATIGDFYDTLAAGFVQVQPAFNTSARQVTAHGIAAIHSVADATAAINMITQQGEGTTMSPDESSQAGQPAHYYIFDELAHGHRLIESSPGKWEYKGAPIRVPTGVSFSAPDTEGVFARTFSDLLRELDACWNGSGSMGDAIGLMFDLQLVGTELIRAGKRPDFSWTENSALPASGAALRIQPNALNFPAKQHWPFPRGLR